jgi:hypothetical protein
MVLMKDIPARINVQATVMDAVPRMTDLTGHSSHIENSPLLSFKRWFNSGRTVHFVSHQNQQVLLVYKFAKTELASRALYESCAVL